MSEQRKSAVEQILDGDVHPQMLLDSQLLHIHAQLVLMECALPPAGAVAEEVRNRGLDKPIKLRLDLEDAIRLAAILDLGYALAGSDDDTDSPEYKVMSAVDNLYDVAMQIPWPLYVEGEGWSERAAASQGCAI